MAIQDELDLLIKFDLPVLPFFSLQDTTDYAAEGISASNVKGNFTISNPLGEIYTNVSWTTPDITLSVSAYFNSVNIPLDNGVPLLGEYTFEYTVQISGGVQPGTYTKTFTIDYQYVSPTANIYLNNNPYEIILSARDNTQYVIEGITPTMSRLFTLIFPDLSGFPDIPTALPYISVTGDYYIDGLYQFTLSNELNYTFETYNVHDTITGSNQILVEDTVDIQSIYCCLKKLNQQVTANPADTASLLKLTRATGLLELFDQAVQFGQYNDANNYIAQIYAVTGCTKGCTCGNLTKTSIQPYWLTVNTPGSGGGESEFRVGDIKATFRTDAQAKWLYLENQVLLITAYQEYYNVVGTMFNNGSEPPGYFRNQDGRSRGIIGAGQGVGLSNRVLGAKYGAETTNVTHNHSVSLNAEGDITIPSLVVNVTITGVTAAGTKPLTIDPYTPEGTVDLGLVTTVPDFTDYESLTIQGDGSTLNPVFIGDAVPYTPAGSSSGNTEDESLSIIGSGTVTSNLKTGLGVTAAACIPVTATEPPTEAAQCEGLTVDDFTIEIAASNIAASLSITPNPHNHAKKMQDNFMVSL